MSIEYTEEEIQESIKKIDFSRVKSMKKVPMNEDDLPDDELNTGDLSPR